ncbi:kazal-type serine protease inhibitor domain-containing protein 1-like [Aplochiton taeniatus]
MLNQQNYSPSLSLEKKVNYSPSLPLKKGNYSPSLPLKKKGNYSPSLPLEKKGNYSPSLPLKKKGNYSPSLPLKKKGNYSPSLPLGKKGNYSPSLPLEKKGFPVFLPSPRCHACYTFPSQASVQGPSEGLEPPLDYQELDGDFDEPRNGSVCGVCVVEQCPMALGCRAGLVLDACHCCQECGNLEGQLCDLEDQSCDLEGQSCDLGGANVFYGVCGKGLRCHGDEEGAEPVCVCASLDAVCGSDQRTYVNPCQFEEAAFSNPQLTTTGEGPCSSGPVIKVPPQSMVRVAGSTLVLLCEVFAFPMALVQWTREDREGFLPGDNPHISVQSRGGPMKYELSSWLQIEDAAQEDSGTYHCVAHNDLGTASASALLGVLGAEEMEVHLKESRTEMSEMMDYGRHRDYNEDYY